MQSEIDTNDPIINVIIPVKNRVDYIGPTLKTLSTQSYEKLRVIVTDDGSVDGTIEVVKSYAALDTRITLVENNRLPGMKENFEHGLDLVESGYVVALGSDDGFMPNGVRRLVDLIVSSEAQLITWEPPLYAYPGVQGVSGQITIPKSSRSHWVSSKGFLERQATDLNYLADPETPMFYVKGAVAVELIKRVRDGTIDGNFYQCPTPDGYSGIVLAGQVERFLFSGEPFTIYGLSAKSQGLAYLSNDESSKRQAESFFSSIANVPMCKELAFQPYSPLISLMTADYLFTSWKYNAISLEYPKVSIERLIEKSLNELRHGLFGSDQVARELQIIFEIADFHSRKEFAVKLARKIKRRKQKAPISGNAISSKAIYLDSSALDVCNIYDAAHRVKSILTLVQLLNPLFWFGAIKNSLTYRLASLRNSSKKLIDFLPLN